jgi:hypothetical protein
VTDPSNNGNVIVVTLKDVYIELMKIKESLSEIKGKADTTASAVPDHETRIRSLEKWRYALPPAILLALASIVVGLLELFKST